MSLSVDVILTSYNRPELVLEAMKSVKAQTYPYWICWVMDDGSNKQTQDIIQSLANTDDRFQPVFLVVPAEERYTQTRYAVAINEALKRSSGDLITYLTDDDIFYTERLKYMAAVFEDSSVYVVYGEQRVVAWDEHHNIQGAWIRRNVGRTREPVCRVDHNSIMHRRSCLQQTGLWDTHPMHWGAGDAQFFRKLVEYYDFVPVAQVLDEHRLHANSLQSLMTRNTFFPVVTHEETS